MRGAVSQDTVFQGMRVCVPAKGYAEVRVRTPDSSAIPGDLATLASSLQPRTRGVTIVEYPDATAPSMR